MRRRIVIIVLIFICFILQCSVLPAVAIGGISHNLLVILTVSFALMRGRREGMFVGFMCGFLADLFFGSALGFQTLVYMYMGYLCGSCYRLFYDDDIKMPILLIAASDLAYGIIFYIFEFLLRGRVQFTFYLGRIILPEVVYTIVLTIVCYRLLMWINHRLERAEQRSVNSFV